MNTKSEKIKCFNEILLSFLNQTTPIVGTSYYYYFKKLISFNSAYPINCASEHMIMFKKEIMAKDESYFNGTDDVLLNEKFNEVIELSNKPSSYVIDELLKLKDIYYKIDADSRDNVWAILQALLQLSIEYKELTK